MFLNNENAQALADKINDYLKDNTFSWLSSDNLGEPWLRTGCKLESEVVVKKNPQGEKSVTFIVAGKDLAFSSFAKADCIFVDGIQIWHTNAVGVRKLEWFKI
jgi:hypothetical protein